MARRNSLSECRWKAHPFEDGIIVSTNGRILSYKSGEEYELTPSDNGRGYLTVSIGLRHPKYVHRLVAETYIPNPYNYPEVNHKVVKMVAKRNITTITSSSWRMLRNE